RARRAQLSGDAAPELLAATALRAPPPGARRVARGPPESDADRRGLRPRGRRARLRASRADAALVARRGGGLLRRPDRADRRAAGLDRPALLPDGPARRRRAPRAAVGAGAPGGRRRDRRLRRRPVEEESHR